MQGRIPNCRCLVETLIREGRRGRRSPRPQKKLHRQFGAHPYANRFLKIYLSG